MVTIIKDKTIMLSDADIVLRSKFIGTFAVAKMSYKQVYSFCHLWVIPAMNDHSVTRLKVIR